MTLKQIPISIPKSPVCFAMGPTNQAVSMQGTIKPKLKTLAKIAAIPQGSAEESFQID